MKPYVICNMITSVDGHINAEGCPESFYNEYQKIERLLQADGWLCGRVTMEDFTDKRFVLENKPTYVLPRDDLIIQKSNGLYAVAVDTKGKLGWESNTLCGDSQLIIVLSEDVSDEYLRYLQDKQISYIFCGKSKVDLKLMLEKLGRGFTIQKLLLEGGGIMNGSMLKLGLIDEISLLIAPAVEGTAGAPSLFNLNKTMEPIQKLELIFSEKLKDDIFWLRYKVLNKNKMG